MVPISMEWGAKSFHSAAVTSTIGLAATCCTLGLVLFVGMYPRCLCFYDSNKILEETVVVKLS